MIEIDKKTRIRQLDKHNIVIEVYDFRTEGASEKEWIIIGYYSSLSHAFQALLDHELFGVPEKKIAIEQCLDAINKCNDKIMKAIGKNGFTVDNKTEE